jgi:hypothetical protein
MNALRSLLTISLLFISCAIAPLIKIRAGGVRPTETSASFTVTNLNDSGTGSLRKAINDANVTSGVDIITFNVTGTINLASPLPTITDQVTIVGNNVELNGAGAGAGANGLTINATGVGIQNLKINRFNGSGVSIQGGSGNTVKGCIIGMNSAFATGLGNGTGVFISNSPDNFIGDANGVASNNIAGNNVDGVRIDGSGATRNHVEYNMIGTGSNGNGDVGNLFNGIVINNAPDNVIQLNTVSGNDRNGIAITGSGSTSNFVSQNTVGLNFARTAALPNSSEGIIINNGASSNQVNGNYISGNTVDGIRIDGAATSGNKVIANQIGTTTFPNHFNGVVISNAPNNIIGPAVFGSENTIQGNGTNGIGITGSTATGNTVLHNTITQNTQHGVAIVSAASNNTIGNSSSYINTINSNGGDGIFIESGTGNRLQSNVIASNGGLGIDLNPDGVTLNDAGDPDAGANNLQNFPVFTSAVRDSGGITTIAGALNSLPNTTFEVQFFLSPEGCDPSGYGEGHYIGSASVTTDANGNTVFSRQFSVGVAGQTFTATAIDPAGNTSEFSPCFLSVNEPAGSLSFSSASYSVNENAGTATVTVTRTGGSFGTVTVNYANSDGTATAAQDYRTSSGTLTFANGETSKTFSFSIFQDTLDEADETVNLTLSNPTGGATLGSPATAILTIIDDDPSPSLSINDATVTEGNSGTTNALFTVTLSTASGQQISVNYSTADGTANAPGDYAAISGTLSFNAGETSKTISVAVNGDTTLEPNETFSVNLTSPVNATLARAQGTGTINNDDTVQPPQLALGYNGKTRDRVGQADNAFAADGLYDGVFTVTLQTGSGNRTVTSLDLQASNGTHWNTAVGDGLWALGAAASPDAALLNNGSTGAVNFPVTDGASFNLFVADSGSNQLLTPGTVLTLRATFADGTNATVSATITAFNDSQFVSQSATTAMIAGNSYLVSVTMRNTGSTVWTPNDPNAYRLASKNPLDNTTWGFNRVNLQAASVAPGEQAVFGFNVIAPTAPGTYNFQWGMVQEGVQHFGGLSTNLSIGVVAAQHGLLQFSASTYVANENGGAATITVTRSGGADGSVTVRYATTDGTAMAGSDYTATSGTLTFNQGETGKSFSIPITNDSLNEASETVSLTLTQPTGGAALGTQSTATLFIQDDDPLPSLAVSDLLVTEGNSGFTNAVFTARLSAASGRTVTYQLCHGGWDGHGSV